MIWRLLLWKGPPDPRRSPTATTLRSWRPDSRSPAFALAELLARVRALVRRTNGRDSPKINLGEVVIDTNSRQVLRDGLALPLTAREYAIFELLASRRGELVTKSTIYDHIFDENDDSLSNLVEVHVSHLRKKVGKNLIQTRRGQGYRVPLEGEPATDTEGT